MNVSSNRHLFSYNDPLICNQSLAFPEKAEIGLGAFWNPPLQLYLECHMLISNLACKEYKVEFTFGSLVPF